MKLKFSNTQPFTSTALAFLAGITVLRVAEFISMPQIEGTAGGNLLLRALTYNLIVCSWVILISLPVFLLTNRFSEKWAYRIAVIWFSMLLICETGLTFYALHNGYLLNSELWIRPFAETIAAIQGAVGLFLPAVLILAIAGFVTGLGFVLKKFCRKNHIVLFTVAVIFALLSVIFETSHLVDSKSHAFIINKTGYLVSETVGYLQRADNSEDGSSMVEYDGQTISEFLSYHPDWEVADTHYPLERKDNGEDALSPYFNESEAKPDVVVIIVESLGNELLEGKFMPFADSLANTGLYWRNCLSTVIRSFGAIPAITGSVGGPKGFQFGKMPHFNSLIPIFKSNGYRTNAFYAGYFTFDCINEYLEAQNTDFLSPFWEEWKNGSVNSLGTSWGYHDKIMFRKTLSELKKYHSPQFSIITTISLHEGLDLNDPKEQQCYENRANRLPSYRKFGKDKRLLSALYTDDALRDFMKSYSSMPNFGNTVFIITGDHPTGLDYRNVISAGHHVPLIIWSPLLKKPQKFENLVTHLDIAPSLCRLMKNRFHLETPETVHWLGDGLSTAGNTKKDMLIVNYNREMREIVADGYYYHEANSLGPEEVFSIDKGMNLTPVKDSAIFRLCRRKLATYRYMFRYTYCNDRLTKHPIINDTRYRLADMKDIKKVVKFRNPVQKPSIAGDTSVFLLQNHDMPSPRKDCKVRISLSADMEISDSAWIDQYPLLVFAISGTNPNWECAFVTNYATGSANMTAGSTCHISAVKNYEISKDAVNQLSIYLLSTSDDKLWLPDMRVNIKNARIKIEFSL